MSDRTKRGYAEDPTADRVAAYPEAGELGTPQDRTPPAAGGPTPPQPAGIDTEILLTGASGGGLGGPAATDAPGDGAGLPGDAGPGEGPPTAQRPRDAGAEAEGEELVDRLDR